MLETRGIRLKCHFTAAMFDRGSCFPSDSNSSNAYPFETAFHPRILSRILSPAISGHARVSTVFLVCANRAFRDGLIQLSFVTNSSNGCRVLQIIDSINVRMLFVDWFSFEKMWCLNFVRFVWNVIKIVKAVYMLSVVCEITTFAKNVQWVLCLCLCKICCKIRTFLIEILGVFHFERGRNFLIGWILKSSHVKLFQNDDVQTNPSNDQIIFRLTLTISENLWKHIRIVT